MAKRIGANQRLKKGLSGKKNRKDKAGFYGQLPEHRKIGNRFIAVISFVLLIGLILYFERNRILPVFSDIEIFKIKRIDVQGNGYIDSMTIISMAEIDSSLSLITVPVKNIEDRLKTNCWIDDVNVVRRIPYTVRIIVKERKPIAIVNMKNVYLIDKTGFLWPLKPHYYWDVPVVSGLKDSSISKSSPRLVNHDLKRMCRFLNDIEKCENPIANEISQIDFSQEGNVAVKLASSPITILLNELEVGRSIGRLNNLLERMENDSSPTTRYINLCHNNIAYIN